MRRRQLLTAIGAVAIPSAGCLSNAQGDDEPTDDSDDPTIPGEPEDRRYEECGREVIPYEQFPEDVQTEIDEALDGHYEADRVYLRETMDVEESYVSVEDVYYRATVTLEDDIEVLNLEKVEPKALPSGRPISVDVSREGDRTVTLEVVAEDGTVLVDETRDISERGAVEMAQVTRVGTHDLTITVAQDGEVEDEVTRSIRINEARFTVVVEIEADEIWVTGVVAELGICRFEE